MRIAATLEVAPQPDNYDDDDATERYYELIAKVVDEGGLSEAEAAELLALADARQ